MIPAFIQYPDIKTIDLTVVYKQISGSIPSSGHARVFKIGSKVRTGLGRVYSLAGYSRFKLLAFQNDSVKQSLNLRGYKEPLLS